MKSKKDVKIGGIVAKMLADRAIYPSMRAYKLIFDNAYHAYDLLMDKELNEMIDDYAEMLPTTFFMNDFAEYS